MTDTEQTDLVNFEAQLAEEAKAISAAIAGSVPTISTRGGVFKFPDGHIEKNELDLVIVAARLSRTLWKDEYSDIGTKDNGIICAAVSDAALDYNTLMPFESAVSPPATSCNSCPQNQWDRTGPYPKKVGDCSAHMEFVVAAPDSSTDEMYLIRGSATGITEGRKLMAEATRQFKHPIKAVVTFGFTPTRKGAPRLTVKLKGPNANYQQHLPKMEQARALVDRAPRWYTPQVQPAQVAQPAPADSGRASRSAAG